MGTGKLIRVTGDTRQNEECEPAQLAVPYGYVPLAAQQTSLLDYWRVLLKRKWLVLACAAIVLTLALIWSLHMTRIYVASARISINPENSNALGFQDIAGTASVYVDETLPLETQVKILQSDTLALQVVKKLRLDQDPRFAGPAPTAPAKAESIALTGPPQLDPTREAGLIGAFKQGLEVISIHNTRLVEVRFSSGDPKLAAEIVNGLVNTFIEQNYKTRYESTMQAADWISRQLADLQIKVETSQEKLLRYQKEHEIVGGDEKQNITTAKLDALSKELTTAETDRIQKQSVYQLTLSQNPEALINLAQNDYLQKLRTQEEDLKSQYAQTNLQFGAAYPKVIELKERIRQVEAAVNSEVKRTVNRVKNDYLGSLQREKMLRLAFEQQKQETNKLNESAIEYSLLRRDADSNRQLYDGLLQKLKEAGISAGLNSSSIHIVDAARVPLAPFKPDIQRNLEMALLLGLAGGIGLTFLLEAVDTTVRTPDEVGVVSALPSLGIIPQSSRLNSRSDKMPRLLPFGPENNNGRMDPIALVAYSRPNSRIAESYRALRTSILLSSLGAPPKVILVTSAFPQEGKTITSINSAIVLAQQGRRVLLVDADLRRAGVQLAFGIKPVAGLSNLLAGGGVGGSVILPSPRLPSLSVLPAGPPPPHPAELLGSPLMQNLLAQWREEFDHVILDSPPALSVTDSVLLSVKVDQVILVIRSGQTKKAALRRVRELLLQVNANIMGVVVNAFNLSSTDHGHYYYSDSENGGYYREESQQAKSQIAKFGTS
jgi:capsular exopolysaccharide synthesis family protein